MLLALLVMAPLFSYALTISFEVVFVNDTDMDLVVEVRQFHSVGFDGNKPSQWTEELLVGREQFGVDRRSREIRKYSSAGGGYWITWVAKSRATSQLLCRAEVELRLLSPVVTLSSKACRVD
jgi:hypothetical protein